MTRNERKIIRRYLKRCAKVFDELPEYPLADRVLRDVFSASSNSDSEAAILKKVALLNALYRTQILDIYRMAKHIYKRKMVRYLKRNRIKSINLIRSGHGIRPKRKSEYNFYSFATKYCHWECPNMYPMFDQYVSVALRVLNKRIKFVKKLTLRNIREYDEFSTAIDSCRKSLKLQSMNYKEFDQSLWILGQLIQDEADSTVKYYVGDVPKEVM